MTQSTEAPTAQGRATAASKRASSHNGQGSTPAAANSCRYLHVLVAEAFLGPCPKGKEANHRDGDRKNNAASNLEFVTHSQNVRHALRLGLRRRKYGQQHLALAVEVGA